jgi:hypothetical protein
MDYVWSQTFGQATGSPLAAPGLQPSACGTVKPSAVASVTEMARPSTGVGAGRPFVLRRRVGGGNRVDGFPGLATVTGAVVD